MICARAYKLLTEQAGFAPEDIVFDPNIFAVATGLEEHNDYGRAFLEAAKQIRTELPYVHVSGGVSNFSFSFRGNDACWYVADDTISRCKCLRLHLESISSLAR